MDLRIQAVKALWRHRPEEVAEMFGVSLATLKVWNKRAKEGNLAPIPHPGARPKLDAEQVQQVVALVKAYPDAILDELVEKIVEAGLPRISRSSLHRLLEAQGITRKKRPSGQANKIL